MWASKIHTVNWALRSNGRERDRRQDSPEDASVAVRKFPEKGWDPSGMGNPSVKREY
jgi:hypothetical protein